MLFIVAELLQNLSDRVYYFLCFSLEYVALCSLGMYIFCIVFTDFPYEKEHLKMCLEPVSVVLFSLSHPRQFYDLANTVNNFENAITYCAILKIFK